MDELVSLGFKAIAAEVTAEGIVLIHADEAEAQRAYCEEQLCGYTLRLEGVRLTWLLPEGRAGHGLPSNELDQP